MKVNKVGFKKLDTISFIVDAVDNDYYGTEGSEYLTANHKDLKVTVVINDVRIGWNNSISVYDLALRNLDHKPYYNHWWYSGTKEEGKVAGNWSVFQPFTCSCGESGCAGIWDGIYVKERGYSVEWRAKREDGYGFLPKTFFNFEKSQYKQAFKALLSDIELISKEFDLVVDPGYCEEQLVKGLDFMKYVKENQN